MEVSETKWEQGEKLNGRLAMIGFVAALGAYVVTGQIIPGVFWCLTVLELTVRKRVVHPKRRKNLARSQSESWNCSARHILFLGDRRQGASCRGLHHKFDWRTGWNRYWTRRSLLLAGRIGYVHLFGGGSKTTRNGFVHSMLEFLIASMFTCAEATEIIGRVRADDRLSIQARAEVVGELIKHSDCDRNANVDWRNALLV